MSTRDKVRELAEKLADGFLGDGHFVAENPDGQFVADAAYNLLRFHLKEQCEVCLRAELKPLLDAAYKAVEYHENFDEHPQCSGCGLASELQDWRAL